MHLLRSSACRSLRTKRECENLIYPHQSTTRTFPEFIDRCSGWFCPDVKENTDCRKRVSSTAFKHRQQAAHAPLGLIKGPKALKNHLWLLSFFLFASFKQKMT